MDIEYRPSTKLIVHDVIRLEQVEILRGKVTPNGNMPIYWCNGILYSFVSPPMAEKVIEDMLQGTIHWMEVQYTELPEYTPLLSLDEEEYKATMNFRVINTSELTIHDEFTKWLKTRSKAKK